MPRSGERWRSSLTKNRERCANSRPSKGRLPVSEKPTSRQNARSHRPSRRPSWPRGASVKFAPYSNAWVLRRPSSRPNSTEIKDHDQKATLKDAQARDLRRQIEELRAQLARYAEALEEEDLAIGREKVAARTREGLTYEKAFSEVSTLLLSHLKTKPEARDLLQESHRGYPRPRCGQHPGREQAAVDDSESVDCVGPERDAEGGESSAGGRLAAHRARARRLINHIQNGRILGEGWEIDMTIRPTSERINESENRNGHGRADAPRGSRGDQGRGLALIDAVENAFGVCECDVNGMIRRVNDKLLGVLSTDRDAIVGRRHSVLLESDPSANQRWARLRGGETISVEGERRDRDGRTVQVEAVWIPLMAPGGGLDAVVALVRDVTGKASRRQGMASAGARIAKQASNLSASGESLKELAMQMGTSADETSARAESWPRLRSKSAEMFRRWRREPKRCPPSESRDCAKSASAAANVANQAVKFAEATNTTVCKLGDSSGEIGKVIKVITRSLSRRTCSPSTRQSRRPAPGGGQGLRGRRQ